MVRNGKRTYPSGKSNNHHSVIVVGKVLQIIGLGPLKDYHRQQTCPPPDQTTSWQENKNQKKIKKKIIKPKVQKINRKTTTNQSS
jgi:hypothetical protein